MKCRKSISCLIEVWPWENIVFVVNCGKLDRFNFNQSRGGGKRKKHIETVFQGNVLVRFQNIIGYAFKSRI